MDPPSFSARLNLNWATEFNLNIWLFKPCLCGRGWCLVHLATLGISSNTLNVWGNGVRPSVRVGVPRVWGNKIICIKSHLNASVNDSASTGAHHSVQIFNLFRNHRHKYEWTNMRGWEGNFSRTTHQSPIFIMALSLCVSVYFHCTLLSLAFVNPRSHSRSGCSVSRARRWVLDPRWILCLGVRPWPPAPMMHT